MQCTGEDLLIKLRQGAEENSKPFKEAVERHFLWLEEVVVEFRKALEDKGSNNLLPKTPSAKRFRDNKLSKTDVDTIEEDGDENDPETRSPAAKKSLVENFENISVASPPRRRRAASRAATLKVRANLKELSHIGSKKRRPSLTESESSAEKKIEEKKRKIRTEETLEVPIEKRDEEELIEINEHLPSPEDQSIKGIEEPSTERSRSSIEAGQDEKITEYSPVVVLEDTGGGVRISTSKTKEKVSLEVKEQSEGKGNSNLQEKKISTVVEKEKPGVEPSLNETVCVLKLDDSDIEEDVLVKDTTPNTIVPEALEKSKNSEKQADVPTKNLDSAVGIDKELGSAVDGELNSTVGIDKELGSAADGELNSAVDIVDREPVVEIVKSQEPDVHLEEPDTGKVVNTGTIKDKVTAIVSETPLVSQEKDTETEDIVVADKVESQDSDTAQVETKPERVGRSTRTKTKNVFPAPEIDEPLKKTRLTRSKLRHSPRGVERPLTIEDSVCAPSIIVTIPKTEETDCKAKEHSVTEEDKAEDVHLSGELPKTRSTRTKKKENEVAINRPVRSTRTKQKRLENESGRSCSQDSAICSGEASSEESVSEVKVCTTTETSNHQNVPSAPVEGQPAVPARRMTRSKVRQLANLPAAAPSSPQATSTNDTGIFSRDCCTPKSDVASPSSPVRKRSPTKFDPRTFAPTKGKGTVKEMAVAYQKHIGIAREVEEMDMQEIQVSQSPARATRHSKGSATKNTKVQRLNQAKITPTYSRDKVLHLNIHRLENSSNSSGKSGSSGRLNKFKKAVNTSINNSSKQMSSLASGTPTEVRRPHNILSGMSSFVTKVQPMKPSREELEEKRQEELKRKREREEETRKKKDELLKMKAEEQKRKNEERMRKVQEAREAREKQQEKERRMKEERLREEQLRKKQQHIMKKKAEEEARLQKQKERMEEEEQQRAEEQKRREMQRVEEEKKLLALKKQKEELEKRKREIEMERIGREKLELQRLKQREIERLAQSTAATSTSHQKPVLNETYTAEDDKENTNLNSTYTKPNQEPSSSVKSHSNEVIPQKTVKIFNSADNYNIRDIRSDDSTDDEEKPKKIIPSWAQGTKLKNALIKQAYYPPDIDLIFPSYLLDPPNLSALFPVKKKRFYSRTSSAIWNTPPSKLFS